MARRKLDSLSKIVIDLKDVPEDFLSRFDADVIPKWKLTGAVITAVGVYGMVDLIGLFGKKVLDADPAQQPWLFALGMPLTGVSWLMKVFSGQFKGEEEIIQPPSKFKVNWLGLMLGMTAGGMVLAGLNPGQILSGIGDIIDGLIPG